MRPLDSVSDVNTIHSASVKAVSDPSSSSRLGLERADTAEGAVDVIAELLEKYGQGGSCMEDECSFTYHNSFLISDRKEAWLLETSGKMWAAERVEGKDQK